MVPAKLRKKEKAFALQAPGLPGAKVSFPLRASLQAVIFHPLNPEKPVRRSTQKMHRRTG